MVCRPAQGRIPGGRRRCTCAWRQFGRGDRAAGPAAGRAVRRRGGRGDGAGGGPARHHRRGHAADVVASAVGRVACRAARSGPARALVTGSARPARRSLRPDRPEAVRAGHRRTDDQATWRRARRRHERLRDSQPRVVLLHGDLRLGNVLDGGPSRGLIAIDPKACVGDPCFDAVDYVVAAAGHEGVEARCQRVAAACGLDGDRLHAWSRVIAPMAAIGHLTADGSDCSDSPARVIDELLALSR
ncbi:aminoglycoside phosphotransferase family protein [Streptomyces sp. SM12]|uniref:aminoglycoside phosphotransferase family protein n=1 Tax=Streptomyces sp. SM12 TaxID=1071602 RepID=UPI0027E49A1E|nr:aminoglycoside phosphotransferase family protein [Streptomyces sp. SM12]